MFRNHGDSICTKSSCRLHALVSSYSCVLWEVTAHPRGGLGVLTEGGRDPGEMWALPEVSVVLKASSTDWKKVSTDRRW